MCCFSESPREKTNTRVEIIFGKKLKDIKTKLIINDMKTSISITTFVKLSVKNVNMQYKRQNSCLILLLHYIYFSFML